MIPRRIVDTYPDKPAEQKIKLQPLHQLTLRADRIEDLQEHRSQELLWRDRRPADGRIKPSELLPKRPQCRVHHRPYGPQGMVLWNSHLQVHVAEQLARPIIHAPHDSSLRPVWRSESRPSPSREAFFNILLERSRAVCPDALEDVDEIHRREDRCYNVHNRNDDEERWN